RVARVLRIVDERPPRKAERPPALLADRAAILARPEAERRHLEIVAGDRALRGEPHDRAPGQDGMAIRTRDHGIDDLVLAELAVARPETAGLQEVRAHAPSFLSTTRAA